MFPGILGLIETHNNQIASGEKFPEGQIVFATRGGRTKNGGYAGSRTDSRSAEAGIRTCGAAPPHEPAPLSACDVAGVMRPGLRVCIDGVSTLEPAVIFAEGPHRQLAVPHRCRMGRTGRL